MKLRNKKMLSLLLATAMVFTMNTSVFALEVGDDAGDEYTVDFVDDGAAEETDGAAEVDSVETDDFAFVDEIDGALDIEGYTDATAKIVASMNKAGWTITGKDDELVSSTNYDEKKSILTFGDKGFSLAGSLDNSKALVIKPSAGAAKGVIKSLKVSGTNETEKTAASVTVTLLSGNVIDDTKSGYGYIDGYKGDDKVDEWAAGLCDGDVVSVEVNKSNMSKKATDGDYKDYASLVLTFSFSTENAEANNEPYEIATTKAGTATVTYYKNIPFCGKGAIKTNIANAFGMSVSAGSTKYTISKITIKFTKGSNVATIKSVKLTGGDKKAAKAIAKGMKGLTMKCYPYNLSKGGVTNKKVNKNGTKLTVKINGRKVTVKNGKADGYGGTSVKLTVNGGKVTVSNSNALCGSI